MATDSNNSPQPATPSPTSYTRVAHFTARQSLVARVTLEVLGRWAARVAAVWVGLMVIFAVFAPFIANSHPYYIRYADGTWAMPLFRHLTPVDILLLLAFFTFLTMGLTWRRSCALRTRVLGGCVILISAAPFAFFTIAWHSWDTWQATFGLVRFVSLLFFGGTFWAVALAVTAIPLYNQPAPVTFKTGVTIAAILVCLLLAVVHIRPPSLATLSQYREALAAETATHAIAAPIPYSPTDRMRDLPSPRLFAPGFYPIDPDRPDLSERDRRRVAYARETGTRLPEKFIAAPGEDYYSRFYLLGTTTNSEDLASRMIHATRIALSIGFIATGIAVFIGTVIGGVLGYFSGWVDLIGLRLVEIFAAIPTIFLLITFVAFYGRNLYLMMVIIGLTGWVNYALFVRAEFLKLRKQDFVQAAKACGVSLWSILFKHMLPNGVAPVLVNASFGIATAILTEAALSFIGLGLVEEPSWGQMLDQALQGGTFNWWIAIFPGLAIFLTVYAYNLLGESMRDAIDPYTQRKR